MRLCVSQDVNLWPGCSFPALQVACKYVRTSEMTPTKWGCYLDCFRKRVTPLESYLKRMTFSHNLRVPMSV